MIEQLKSTLQDLADEGKAKIMMRFFKTGKGEYDEGDIFFGISVPNQRLIAKEFYQQVSLNDIENLLNSNIHEYRLTALLMLVLKYEKSKDELVRKEIIDFYLAQTSQINNWDLVDTSCYKILGHYCFHQKREELLFELASSEDLWEKRIAIVSTMYFIKQKSFSIVPEIVLKNLNHSQDLMHKANGWMLREMGKMNEEKLIEFLDEYTLQMPRTTL